MARYPVRAPGSGARTEVGTGAWLDDGLDMSWPGGVYAPDWAGRTTRRSRMRAGAAKMLRGAGARLARVRMGRGVARWIMRAAIWLETRTLPAGQRASSAGRQGRAVWAEVIEPGNKLKRRPATRGGFEREAISEPFLLIARALLAQKTTALTCRPLVPGSRIAVMRRHPGGRTALLYMVHESRHMGAGVFRVVLGLTSRLYRQVD